MFVLGEQFGGKHHLHWSRCAIPQGHCARTLGGPAPIIVTLAFSFKKPAVEGQFNGILFSLLSGVSTDLDLRQDGEGPALKPEHKITGIFARPYSRTIAVNRYRRNSWLCDKAFNKRIARCDIGCRAIALTDCDVKSRFRRAPGVYPCA
jgi:hypothetical protein